MTSGGEKGFPQEVSYGAANAALVNYTLSASLELSEFGVTAERFEDMENIGERNSGAARHLASYEEFSVRVARDVMRTGYAGQKRKRPGRPGLLPLFARE